MSIGLYTFPTGVTKINPDVHNHHFWGSKAAAQKECTFDTGHEHILQNPSQFLSTTDRHSQPCRLIYSQPHRPIYSRP